MTTLEQLKSEAREVHPNDKAYSLGYKDGFNAGLERAVEVVESTKCPVPNFPDVEEIEHNLVNKIIKKLTQLQA